MDHLLKRKNVELTLSTLSAERILIFGCLCVERIVPLIDLWDKKVARIAEETLIHCWNLTKPNSLPIAGLPAANYLGNSIEKIKKIIRSRYDSDLLFSEEVLNALVSLVRYCHSLDKNLVVHTSDKSYQSRYIYAKESANFLTHWSMPISTKEIMSTAIVMEEQNIQLTDLAILSLQTEQGLSIEELRHQASNKGQEFKLLVEKLIAKQSKQWQYAKATYRVGTTTKGMIKHTMLGIMLVQVEAQVFAKVEIQDLDVNAWDCETLIGHVLKATISAYDEDERLLVLKSPMLGI